MKKKTDQQFLDAMSKDPGNWKGPFYINRKDPRMIVPKYHSSMGWTLNFANLYTWLAVIGFILIIILAGFL
jgi:uncharacterized membrane protein